MADSKTIMELDMVAGKGVAKVDAQLNKLSKQTTALGSSAKKTQGAMGKMGAGVKSSFAQFGPAAIAMAGTTAAIAGFNVALQGMLDKETALADFSAITGVTGEGLEEFGDIAVELSNKFGTDVVGNIESFKSILSRLGPEMASSSEAVAIMGENVNVLAKAAGLTATESMDALTTAVLQFGVDLSDPVAAANEMTSMMNVMAASSKAGAMEVPDLAVALTQVGATAKNLNVSFEETNAMLETLALGGKKGAEAGVALRNIFAKMAGPTKKAERYLAKLGLSATDLGETLTTKGGNAAILQLKEQLVKIESPAEQAAILVKLFGTENLAAAQTVLNNTDATKKYTAAITGTNTALEQAAINMDTNREKWNRFTTFLTNNAVGALEKVQQSLGDTFAGFEDLGNLISGDTSDSVLNSLERLSVGFRTGFNDEALSAFDRMAAGAEKANAAIKKIEGPLTAAQKRMTETGNSFTGVKPPPAEPFDMFAKTIGLTAEETAALEAKADAANKKLKKTGTKVIPPLVGSLGAMQAKLQAMNDQLINRTPAGTDAFDALSKKTKQLAENIELLRQGGTDKYLSEMAVAADGMIKPVERLTIKVKNLGLALQFNESFTQQAIDDNRKYLDTVEQTVTGLGMFQNAIGGVFGAIGEGAEGMKDALKQIGTSVITLAESMLISAAAAGWAKGVMTFGASLATDIAYVALGLTALEGAKAAIASLEVGTAYVPSDQLAMIHQGEAVLPKPMAESFRRGESFGSDFFSGPKTQNVRVIQDRTRRVTANGSVSYSRSNQAVTNARVA